MHQTVGVCHKTLFQTDKMNCVGKRQPVHLRHHLLPVSQQLLGLPLASTAGDNINSCSHKGAGLEFDKSPLTQIPGISELFFLVIQVQVTCSGLSSRLSLISSELSSSRSPPVTPFSRKGAVSGMPRLVSKVQVWSTENLLIVIWMNYK